MGSSIPRTTLYRTLRRLVILAIAALLLSANALAQFAKENKASKGPRALALLQETPGGKMTIVPVAIMVDGQFFDAGAYKADPVPMALWSGTVYQGVRTGVSQGLFTVRVALERPETHQWKGDGTWETEESLKAAKPKKEKPSNEPRGMNEDEGPPVLRHSGAEKPKPPAPAPSVPAQAPAPVAPPAPSAPPTPVAPAPPPTPPAPANPPAPAQPATSPTPEQVGPVLRRGKPAPLPPEPETEPASGPKATKAAPQVHLIPAISDADGPDPRPYAYTMKPEEEQQFRTKMLSFAATAVKARAAELAAAVIGAPAPPRSTAAKKAAAGSQPKFDDVKFRVLDLANSNEPLLILTATAQIPAGAGQKESAASNLQYLLTLIFNQDVNGDYHKVFSNVTDTQHLDVLPNYDFIDAVDADGDGRGELLFREASDSGSAFVIDRVIGDQLYPLFQGTL